MTSAFDVGVMFVHGIGEQRPGDTVAQFAKPFAEFVVARESVLNQPVEMREDTRDGTKTIELHPPPGGETPTWLLAEGHWADAFVPPTYRSLVRWALVYGPWLMQCDALHWINREGRHSGAYWAVNALLAANGGGAIILIALRAAVVTFLSYLLQLVVIATLPFPRLLAGLQRALTVSVGDSFALVADPHASRLMSAQVGRHLDLMKLRCRQVIVVAHSQGAAVTHALLKERGSEDIASLITLGAGIRKLTLLQLALTKRRYVLAAALLRVIVLCMLLAAVLLLVRAPESDALWMYLFWTAAATVFVVPALGYWPVRHIDKVIRDIPGFDSLTWHDCYTLMDPIPGGQIDCLQDDPRATYHTSQRTFNRSSMFRDHSDYQHNPSQVLSLIWHCGREVAGNRENMTGSIPDMKVRLDRLYRLRVLLIGQISAAIGAYVIAGMVVAHNRALANVWGVLLLIVATLGSLLVWHRMFFAFHREQESRESTLSSHWYPMGYKRYAWMLFPFFGLGGLAVWVQGAFRRRMLRSLHA